VAAVRAPPAGGKVTKTSLVTAVVPFTIAALACTSGAAVPQLRVGIADQALAAPNARVRGGTSRLAVIITNAAAQSETFRGLVERIGTTDGLVYVTEGKCAHWVRACLLHDVTVAGPHRVLRIIVDPEHSELDLMASIGHELQHVMEVLGNRTIRSGKQIRLLYQLKCPLCYTVFETDAAVRSGRAVREELEASAAAPRHDR
jgi:hypothetical protein